MSELRPWDRQPGESKKAFHCFVHFRDLPPHERSLSRAYTAHRRLHAPVQGDPETPLPNEWEGPKQWKDWKREWNWEARADAHDAEVAEEQRLARIKAIAEMNERHANIATAVQGKVIARLNGIQPNDLSAGQLIAWLKEATTIERRARGEATDIVKHDAGPGMNLSALSDDDLEQIERLVAKTQAPRVDPT